MKMMKEDRNKYLAIAIPVLGRCFVALFALVLLLFMTACEQKSKRISDVIKESPQELYIAAEKLSETNYRQAVQKIEKIEKYYPHSSILADAELLKAEIYYKNDCLKDVVFVADYFIDNFPAHPQIEYMYYLRAMAFFKQISVASRDQSITEEAIVAMNELKSRFPSGRYAEELEQKLHYAYTIAADKEMQIGRYYAKRRNIVGAIQRFHNVVYLYSYTMLVEEALYRLTWCYMQLGLRQEAENYVELLKHNYRSGKWLKLANGALRASISYTDSKTLENIELFGGGKAKVNEAGVAKISGILHSKARP